MVMGLGGDCSVLSSWKDKPFSSLMFSSVLSQFLTLGDFQSFSFVLQLYKVLAAVGFSGYVGHHITVTGRSPDFHFQS